MNVHTKFEVRTFTRSCDNSGTQKIWLVPGYANAAFFKILTGFCSDGPCQCARVPLGVGGWSLDRVKKRRANVLG